MASSKKHRVLTTNPRHGDGEAEIVVRGTAKYFLIIPISEELFEIHYGGKYLGESTTLSGANSFINRSGASAPVLIKNTNGGYDMYNYKTPAKSNPTKKKATKRKATKRKATKKKSTKRKATKKKSTKRKATKKKSTGSEKTKSVDASVRDYITKSTGKRPIW